MVRYAALHCHSEYSTRDSLIRVDELPELAAKEGWEACAITDHGGIEGVPKFMKAAKKHGIRPLVGCELYVGCPDSYDWTRYSKKDFYHHLTVLVKDASGFSSLTKLLSIGHRDFYDAKRQKAIIPLPLVLDGLTNCVILTGCFSSPFWRKTEKAADDLGAFIHRFKDDFFIEVQPLHDWEEQIKLNRMITDVADALKVEVVVTPDCHFGTPEEHRFHDALLAVADRKSIHDPKVWRFSTKRSFIGSPRKAEEDLGQAGIPSCLARCALEATGRVCERIKDWSWNDLPLPRLPEVEGDMRAISWQGLEGHGLKGREEYEDRLTRELAVFTGAGLDRYLLLVRHCLGLFQREGAGIGPRGSVGGSLVAYCLGLTPIDPIAHGLSFERFYAPGRTGWPDVDIDVDEEFRERVPEILRKEFGEDHVAQISNYTTFGLRSSIRDAARAYGIAIEDDSKFQDDDKDAGDVEDIPPGKELARKSPDAIAFARKLVGRVRQYGAHAGGFVITADSLMGGRSAIVSRGKDKALAWDMEVAEELGFVKLDFLGLDSLSALKMIGESIKMDDWTKIPLDDPAVYEDFGKGLTAGVPQFLSSGLRSFIRSLKPTSFEDLVWATSAFRPGALGQRSPEELAKAYHDDPNGTLVFQEDVMKICVECAGFSWPEATKVQKTMAKSKGIEAMGEWTDKFVEGCTKTVDADPVAAREYWERLLNFGRYAFNKAHATAYSWNSYRIAWAKRRHPLEAFAALLNSEENAEPILAEAPKFGVKILPPDPNRSGLRWEKEPEGIRVPLTEVDGMDLRIAKVIMRVREKAPFVDRQDFIRRMGKTKYLPSLVENLFSGRLPGYNFVLPVLEDRLFVKKHLLLLGEEIEACTQCELRIQCRKPVPPEPGRTNVMIVGEAPGWEEDKAGRPFVGRSGQHVDKVFLKYGLSGKDFTWTNAAKCAPPFVREGEDAVIPKTKVEELSLACPWLEKEIELVRPPLILALGKRAWQKLGGQGSITKVNGMVKEIHGAKVLACLHPAFVLRDQNRMVDFEQTIEKFARLYQTLIPPDGTPPERRLPEPVNMKARIHARLREFDKR